MGVCAAQPLWQHAVCCCRLRECPSPWCQQACQHCWQDGFVAVKPGDGVGSWAAQTVCNVQQVCTAQPGIVSSPGAPQDLHCC